MTVLVIACCVTNDFRTQQLKTATVTCSVCAQESSADGGACGLSLSRSCGPDCGDLGALAFAYYVGGSQPPPSIHFLAHTHASSLGLPRHAARCPGKAKGSESWRSDGSHGLTPSTRRGTARLVWHAPLY